MVLNGLFYHKNPNIPCPNADIVIRIPQQGIFEFFVHFEHGMLSVCGSTLYEIYVNFIFLIANDFQHIFFYQLKNDPDKIQFVMLTQSLRLHFES